MKKKALLLFMTLTAIAAASGCGRKDSSSDPSSSHTTAAETMAEILPSSSEEETTVLETQKPQEETKDQPADVSASVKTYKEGNVSIQYPELSNLSDSSVQNKVNQLLYSNALQFLEAYSVDSAKDTVTVECDVISADRRRVTVVYTGLYSAQGASYPTNLFYTNTIDTAKGEDIELTDYADPYTLAGYILSGDCQFETDDSQLNQALMDQRSDRDINTYTQMFQNADFPYKESEDDPVPFPQVFSYEDGGTIYVSLPVSHALGDFALVKYTPDTK